MVDVRMRNQLITQTILRDEPLGRFKGRKLERGIRKMTNIQNMIECGLQTPRAKYLFLNHSINQ